MTVRSHIAEVLRQGVWASLTGGWFYDPRQSLFCNTLHLYIWIVLFLFPLILGLFVHRSLHWPLNLSYCLFLAVLFGAIKLVVWYLHRIFDSHDPVDVVSSDGDTRPSQDTMDIRNNRRSSIPNLNDIELSTFHRNEPSTPCQTIEDTAPAPNSTRTVRIRDLGVTVSADIHPTQRERASSGDSRSQSSDQALLSGFTTRGSRGEGEVFIEHQPEATMPEESPFKRKYSEPNFGAQRRSSADLRRRLKRRQSSGGREGVRRVQSSLERGAASSSSSFRLSHHTLEECKMRGTRKSYPSKTSSTDIFLCQARPLRGTAQKDLALEGASAVPDEDDEGNDDAPPSPRNRTDSIYDEGLEETADEDCDEGTSGQQGECSRAASYFTADSGSSSNTLTSGSANATGESDPQINRPDSPLGSKNQFLRHLRVKLNEFRAESTGALPEETSQCSSLSDSASPRFMAGRASTPDLTWLFDQASIHASTNSSPTLSIRSETCESQETISLASRPSDFPRAVRSLRHVPHSSGSRSSGSQMDVKEELKVLLEQIIESHPEAIEAIEIVRERRLGRREDNSGAHARWNPPNRAVVQMNPMLPPIEPPPVAPAGRIASGRSDTRDSARSSGSAGLNALAGLAARSTTHVAASHDDTTEGALHSFEDENGQLFYYAFEREGLGTAQTLNSSSVLEMLSHPPHQSAPPSETRHPVHLKSMAGAGGWSRSSSEENFMADNPCSVLHPASSSQISRDPHHHNTTQGSVSRRSTGRSSRNPLHAMMERALVASGSATTPGELSNLTLGSSSRARAISGSGHSSSFGGSTSSIHRLRFLTGASMGDPIMQSRTGNRKRESIKKKKVHYKVSLCPQLWPSRTIMLNLDRLKLQALFDRNRSPISAVLDLAIAVLTGFLATTLLQGNYFQDIWLIIFCFVVAGCQFSLLKSVQPDASSPIHGYNWLVTYSRPVYLCFLSAALIGTEAWLPLIVPSKIIWIQDATRKFLTGSILFLPLACTLGLLPQVNTFMLHVMEQVDMHFLGGTAAFGLSSSIYSLAKSAISAGVLFGISQGAILISPETKHSVFFSFFCAILVSLSYLLSRSSSDLSVSLFTFMGSARDQEEATLPSTPFQETLRETVRERLRHDVFVSIFFGLLTFGLHSSTAFSELQPTLMTVFTTIAILFGLMNHYIIPQMRKQTPWLFLAQPILKSREHGLFETTTMARVMWFERLYALVEMLERNLLYPALVLCAVSDPKVYPDEKLWNSFIVSFFMSCGGLKLLRTGFCSPNAALWPLVASTLFFHFDMGLTGFPSVFLPYFYFAAIIWPKVMELMLKLGFVFSYIAPWQISWGSAFHAFAQPFAVPHSALTLAQALISSLISAPLNPFLGSSFFILSYMRPVKFWEKDYNTRRVDHSNTRLISQIDRGPMMDDSNLNAIFYEHLTRSLQKSLAGDLALGRWATSVAPGDCFILASFYLNCLVHIVEVGNGFVSFQLRGLEFRGTYCQQREVEAISEDIAEGEGCCCCEPGRIPGFLSLNTAWALRWLAWEVTTGKYILEGYSITDNSAVSMLQVHELRRLLVTLYVKCILYYAVMSPKLEEWLATESFIVALEPVTRSHLRHVDVDAIFSLTNDEDYDTRLGGISLRSFCDVYMPWISYCAQRRGFEPCQKNSLLVALCYSLSLVGRRALGTASHNRHSSAAESFLYGLHSLFKGDLRITSARDEWVFGDMDILRCIIAPAVRMALKLHQDHFMTPEDFEEPESFFERMRSYEKRNLFISHEHDPAWRQAVLSNTPSLLALRHVFDDGQDDFKVIMLNKRHLTFRLIKLNKESVRSFWAGQQQELIFLRNRNPERGSIQNARQVLRNMINSSADQPIGYPIYVSPLTTSFYETHSQMGRVTGPSISLNLVQYAFNSVWAWFRRHCGMSGSSASLPQPAPTARTEEPSPGADTRPPATTRPSSRPSMEPREVRLSSSLEDSAGPTLNRGISFLVAANHPDANVGGSIEMTRRRTSGRRGSPGTSGMKSSVVCDVGDGESSGGKSRVRLGSLYSDQTASASVTERVRIKDPTQVYKTLNVPRGTGGQTIVVWPSESWKRDGGKSGWGESWKAEEGMEGSVVHRWTPSNPDLAHRSHIGKVILLIQIDPNIYVPINEDGVTYIGEEV